MANTLKKGFSCTQNQLYRICYIAWEFCQQNIAAFSRFSAMYDDRFIEDKIAEIDAAKKLKNKEQRNLQTSEARLALVQAAADFCESWTNLRRYITKAFKGDARQVNLLGAGSPYYPKACLQDWDALSSLLQNASDYISLKKDILLERNNMPAGFITPFLDSAASCNNLLQDYKQMALGKRGQTITKAEANNAIHKELVSMLADAQVIFKKTSSIKNQFVYTRLYEQIKSQSPASIKGCIEFDGRPLPGAVITVQRTQLTAVTNKKGYFCIGRASAGSWIIDITKPNFTPYHEGIILTAGTAKHLNIQLQPIALTQLVEMHTQGAAQAV